MKSFAMKEMWKFSQFQLKEMFGYGKKKAFIQLLFLRSFSICVFCALVSGESLKECLSLIEQLLILLSYYFTFWSLSLRKEIVILVKSRFYENFFCSFPKKGNRKVDTDLFFRREMVNFKNA